MALKTLKELLFPLRGTLGKDYGLDDILEALLIDYLNLAQEDMLNTLPSDVFTNLTKKWSIDSVSGTLEYTFPTDAHRLLSLTANGKAAQMIDAKRGEYYTSNLPTAYATNASERPLWWIQNAKINVLPDPAASTVGFYKVSGIMKPTRMVAYADSTSVLDEYISGQIMNATIRALIASGKGNEAQALQGKYTEWVQGVIATMQASHKITSVEGRPATAI